MGDTALYLIIYTNLFSFLNVVYRLKILPRMSFYNPSLLNASLINTRNTRSMKILLPFHLTSFFKKINGFAGGFKRQANKLIGA